LVEAIEDILTIKELLISFYLVKLKEKPKVAVSCQDRLGLIRLPPSPPVFASKRNGEGRLPRLSLKGEGGRAFGSSLHWVGPNENICVESRPGIAVDGECGRSDDDIVNIMSV
jgi:hypothetical protein